MRWDGLFADLEAQWERQLHAQTLAEAAELTRGEWAGLPLAARLRGARGRPLRLLLRHGHQCELTVQAVGEGWIGGRTPGGDSVLVRQAAITAVDGPLAAAVTAEGHLGGGPTLGSVLRRVARSRAAVEVVGLDGAVVVEGTVDRVGADHIDVARHARDDARRASSVRGVLVVPLEAVALVRTAGHAL
ncbi:hypothetical protein ACSBQY_04060 [Micrococcus lylae]|uniref:Uncharacterized protein n=1 Tax=Micrococcus lylae TaxID=1273 RepID=A0ABY2K4Z7_9MICC|nr:MULTISPECIES: hypothetical protein [Micrococcus]OFR87588.1 hypothetical protein HMPREF2863_03015 [Micrococcus sp. HMSC067E09]TFI00331.1 hypothetical protein E4A49_02785 [Micrococcus lylae]WIK83167.1 hypothetical protein CJ228_005060 [Micrococcus lylae]